MWLYLIIKQLPEPVYQSWQQLSVRDQDTDEPGRPQTLSVNETHTTGHWMIPIQAPKSMNYWLEEQTPEQKRTLELVMHQNLNSWPKPKSKNEETKAENTEISTELLVPLHLCVWLWTKP